MACLSLLPFLFSFSHLLKLGGLLAFSLFVPALDFTIKRQKKINQAKHVSRISTALCFVFFLFFLIL